MRCTELSISHKRKEKKTNYPGFPLFVCLFVVLAVWLCDGDRERVLGVASDRGENEAGCNATM